ncbi:MAG: hypothetical protein Q9227_008096 [Pyrenula ochraceoflavens]
MGAQEMARRANERLHDNDDEYMARIFFKIFKVNRNDEEVFAWLDRTCLENSMTDPTSSTDSIIEGVTHDAPTWAPNLNRLASNYRIYCDNDPQDPDGYSRWTLRDPPGFPQAYVINRERPNNNLWYPQWRDWRDRTNGVRMGPTRGCQTPQVQAVTYSSAWRKRGQPSERERATITVGVLLSLQGVPNAKPTELMQLTT